MAIAATLKYRPRFLVILLLLTVSAQDAARAQRSLKGDG
jgi:hypothetical protein